MPTFAAHSDVRPEIIENGIFYCLLMNDLHGGIMRKECDLLFSLNSNSFYKLND